MDLLTQAKLVGAAVTLAVCVVCYTALSSPLRDVPGPFLAKFTNLWRFCNVLTRRAEHYQRRLHDELGPAVRLGPNMVSISDPAMIEKIYSRKPAFLKSDFYAVNDLNLDGRRVPNIFSTRDERYSTQVMKPVQKLFSMGSLLKMEPLLDKTISYFLQRLDEEFASPSRVCRMADWLHFCAWDLVSEITFSEPMGFLKGGYDVFGLCGMVAAAMDYFSVVGMMPWLDLFLDKNTIKRLGPPFLTPAVEFSLRRIKDRRSGSDGRSKFSTPDFLDGYLDAREQNPGTVTDDTVLSYLMANVAAGSDTVATELRAILYYLCKDPACMERLKKELDEAQVQIPLSWTKSQTLPYLCACVEEGIRLMPGISLPLERVVGEDGLLLPGGEVYLPPKTIVGINPWVVNRDRQVFGEDADLFRPERWLPGKDEKDDECQARLSRMRDSDLTFGAGKRQCAGRNLALLECHKIIGSLVRAFDIQLADPNGSWNTHNSWFMRQSEMDMRVEKRTIV